MNEIIRITVNDQEIILDRSRLEFSEGTLGEYSETEGGWYDYFGARLAEAEYEHALLESEYEIAYSEKYIYYKEAGGGTEKYVDAKAKSDQYVISRLLKVMQAKMNVKLLQQHLKAWDKNHENAQSRGHFLRKEMEKLNRDIHI